MQGPGVVVTVLFSLKPEHADAVCAQLPLMVEDTKKRPGFRDVEIVRQTDDPTKVLFFEHWDDAESYQRYIAWRTERGDMDSMGETMAAPPTVQIWPLLVAKK